MTEIPKNPGGTIVYGLCNKCGESKPVRKYKGEWLCFRPCFQTKKREEAIRVKIVMMQREREIFQKLNTGESESQN